MARILIAGYGALGRKLTPILAAGKHEIWGLNRSGSVSAQAQPIKADLTHPETLTQLPQFDYLIYTATPSERSEAGYQNAYLTGLKNILNASARNSTKHIFFVSSTSVYHQSKGEWVDELSETQPTQFSGKIILAAENYLRQSGKSHSCVRFGGIYGDDRLSLIRSVQANKPVIKTPPVYTNRIHEDDCAGVLAFLLERHLEGVTLESVYLAVDDAPADEWTVKQWLAQEMGLPPLPEEPVDGSVNQNKRCSNAQLKALGYHFLYPSFQQGYASIWLALEGK
ncbi:MAG TPA: SDR family oxidoreductase [Pseudomonadales bacterium]|nr:SDR family oxidoreductase [Pseudomonadales bacterium]